MVLVVVLIDLSWCCDEDAADDEDEGVTGRCLSVADEGPVWLERE